MDRQRALELFAAEPSRWDSEPAALKALVLQLLSGRDQDGNPAPLSIISARFDGQFGYRAGVQGSPDLPDDARVVSIAASAPATGNATVTINGGDPITVEAGRSWSNDPEGRLVEPDIVFAGTSAYFVELVTMPEGDA